MKKLLLILLIPFISYTQTQIGVDIDGEEAEDHSGWSVNLSSDGSIIAIGAPGNDGNGSNAGHVRIYQNIAGTWSQIGEDIDGEASNDRSGVSISLSSDGSIVAIGAPNNNEGGSGPQIGHVRVYENQSGTWSQLGEDIEGDGEYDVFGSSLSLSSNGSILAIGASEVLGDVAIGYVRIFNMQSGSWTQLGQTLYGEAELNIFGEKVSLSSDGSIVAVSAPGNDGNGQDSGHVRVFQYIAETWTQIGEGIDGEEAFDDSGESLCLSSDGSTVSIGARYNDGNGVSSGHVRVYENIAGTWTQIGEDIDGEETGDNSGGDVSLSSDGSIVAIGARRNDGNGFHTGHVRVYQNQSGTWIQIGEDIDGEAYEDASGRSVSLSSDGSMVAIGATGNDPNGFPQAGHVRVYDLSAVLASDSFVEESFKIYPNPVSEFLTIELKNNITLEKVHLYNSLGQLVKTSSLSKINVSELASGTYLLQVVTNEGNAAKTIIIE